MDNKIKAKLIDFLENGQPDLALSFVKNIKATSGKRTDKQNSAYWLWLTMIEDVAENQGVTWDVVLQNASQLRVTKENVHEAVKQLAKALWGVDSTTQIQKIGQIEIIIDHVTDLFGKVGLEIPPFPSREAEDTLLNNLDKAKKLDYPSDYKEPTV